MSENNHVKTVVVKSADIFVQEIASNGPRFGGSYYADTWYFRGHANSDWPLVPNVFRETAMLMLGEWLAGYGREQPKQIALEARLLLEFAILADKSGLPLPGNAIALREELRKAVEFSFLQHG